MAIKQPSEIIDSHVSVDQCQRALDALLKHAHAAEKKREENELLPGKEHYVWLVLAVKQMRPEKKFKPFKIPIVHPLIDPRTTPVCLITKDPQREYKDLLASHNIKFISRVVGLEKLKGKFKPFEARRMLLQENGLFLADQRVVPLLPKLLGKRFFEAKKQPIPVNLTRKDLKGELERAISSTYMHQNQGTCTSIKIGVLSQTPTQILANLRSALPEVVKHVQGGWDNVQSFQVKTSTSTSLPVWNCSLEDAVGGRWDGLVVSEESSAEDGSEVSKRDGEEESQEGMEAEAAVPPSKAKESKKRPAGDEESKPVKKAKAAREKSTARSSAVPPVDLTPKRAPTTLIEVEAPLAIAPTTPKAADLAPKEKKARKGPPGLDDPAESGSAALSGKGKKAMASANDVPRTIGVAKVSDAADVKAPRKGKAAITSVDEPALKPAQPASTSPPRAARPRTGKDNTIEGNLAAATSVKAPSFTPAPSIMKEEMKRKRSAAGGEKKKVKAVKGKLGKSVKEVLLRKK